jgi:hypothetical protein
VTLKPVPSTIVSSSISSPLAVTTDRSRTSRIPSLTTSVFGAVSAGYQSFDSRIRLQPIV